MNIPMDHYESSSLLKRPIAIALIAIVLAGAAATSYYFYNESQKTRNLLQNPSQAAQEESKVLLSSVGKLMVLPTTEQPTVATVADVSKLRTQAFFASAQNGDKVIVYSQARKAILYRPSINKIIEVSPLNLGDQTAQPTPVEQKTPVKVVVYNGTTTAGLASTTITQLKGKYPTYQVDKGNASKTDYKKTIVVDLKGTNAAVAKDIAGFVSGEVGVLPKDEVKPEGDILVILGK